MGKDQLRPRTGEVETAIGELYFDHNYPMNPTVQHHYDTMDLQRTQPVRLADSRRT
jgi:hypothetical protein